MKIINFKLSRITAELKKPFVTNIRMVEAVEDVLLSLYTDEGAIGYGEAPPTVAITGEDINSIEKAIKERIFPAIKGVELGGDDIFETLRESSKNNSAKACVDMALYDILAKRADKPLCEYLGGRMGRLKSDITISLTNANQMLLDSKEAFGGGFSILKIKLGESEEESVKTLRLIREALPNVVIRVDANQAWSAKKSLRIIEQIAPLQIELIEQPVKADDFNALKEVSAKSAIPILADESVFGYEDAVRILDERAADFINLKLMKSGGIYEAAKIANLAKQRGAKIMIGSMLESTVSVSAAAHFALAYGADFCDLDAPFLAKEPNVATAFCYDKDEIYFLPCAGIGVYKAP